jgi:putative transposase
MRENQKRQIPSSGIDFDLWNYKAFPKAHWKRIRTTNGVERINKELKRRTRVAGAYPSDQSLIRVAGSIVMDINEEWITGKRYLSMDEEWTEPLLVDKKLSNGI